MKVLIFVLIGCFLLLALYSAYGVHVVEKQFPPIGKFVDVQAHRVHYIDKGEGSSIVLVHGASTTLRDFHTSIFTPLTNNHRVIALDRPGYGYSDRPRGHWPDPSQQAQLIRELLVKLDVSKPILVGHSWSGSVVLAYLLAFPDEVSGGVLLAGGSHQWQGGVAWYNHMVEIPLLGNILAHTLIYPVGQLLMNNALQSVFTPNPVPFGYKERTGVILTLRPQSFLANAQDIRQLSEFLGRQSKHYDVIENPLLLITGDKDTVVPPHNHANKLIKQVPHAELVVLENTGHAPHHSQPDVILELIKNFAHKVSRTGI